MIGNIYCIYDNNEICYVGSTIQALKKRWNDYRSHHDNPNSQNYDRKISMMMRKHGISNFKMELLETVEVTHERELCSIEDDWIDTFKELDFELYNTRGAYVTLEETRQKELAYNNQKIPCPLCGKVTSRAHLRRHQRSSNCI